MSTMRIVLITTATVIALALLYSCTEEFFNELDSLGRAMDTSRRKSW